MKRVEIVARRWGDSIAIIIPREVTRTERIRPNDRVSVIIEKEDDLSDLFGKFKTKKSPQELKDESRKGWE